MAPEAPASQGGLPRVEVLRLLQAASREVRELDVGRCMDVVAIQDLTPLRFATEYVARNKPVVITGAIDDWPAMQLWGERYLTNHPAGQTVVTVDVTPNGRGDAITTVADPSTGALSRWFVTPHERRMRLVDFFSLMRETRARDRRAARDGAAAPPREVPYMQHQNSNLTEELSCLTADVGPGLAWAEQVFGGPPEATNLWIGDERSTTSFHKDHYENLYAVIRGTKIFTLLPPCDAYRMYLTRAPAASYMPYADVAARTVAAAGSAAAAAATAYGEVSPQPGGAPSVKSSRTRVDAAKAAAEEAAAAASEPVAAEQGSAATREPAAEADGSGRLVAVLQDPGYEVLWSAVDTSTRGVDAAADAEARRTQPLFYGHLDEPEDAEGWNSTGDAASGQGADGHGRDSDRDSGAESGGDSDGDADVDGDADADVGGNESDDSEAGGRESDPWDAAGGAPLVVEVGPGEVLYLPSLWYHQVEQRTLPTVQPPPLQQEQPQQQGSDSEPESLEARARAMAAAIAAAAGVDASRLAAAGGGGAGKEGGQGGGDREEDYVIAVNFWYDMKYDSRYSSFKLVESLAVAAGLAEAPPQQETGGL